MLSRIIVIFALFSLVGSWFVSPALAYGQLPIVLDRKALDYDRYELTSPDKIEKITHPSSKLRLTDVDGWGVTGKTGLAGVDGWGVTGWFEYDFTVGQSGWYELITTISGGYKNLEYIVDPLLHRKSTDGGYFYVTAQGFDGKTDKVGNIWLSAGKHTLRVQQYFWTGFPAITNLVIKRSPSTIAGSARATLSGKTTVFRKGACDQLVIYAGPKEDAESLTVWIKDFTSGLVREKLRVPIPDFKNPQKQKIPLYCQKEGVYRIAFGDGAGHPIAKRDVGELVYEVIDTEHHVQASGDIAKILVQEIDCVTKPPDYSGGGDTRVVHQTFGEYRESGDADWEKYQQLTPALRLLFPEPSWFAYKLKVGKKQQPYMVEVDYPDDRLRTFAIVLREGSPLTYPVAGGVDSGGEFLLSNSMATHTLVFWPRDVDTRIVFMNARQGSRAAAARIRVYRLAGEFPALLPTSRDGRNFANWYEEGANFLSIYGAPDESVNGSRVAIERWASAVSYMGGNILSPTVNVYNFVLYPSEYNLAFSSSHNDDVLRRMLLIAEKYGMKVLPEVHPRADELAWPYAKHPEPKPNLLVSKDGKTLNNLPPYYNPIYPANQDWYVNMIGELADNYKDSSALLGVSLRLMQWQNPTLNNFHSLDWGYDDYTIGLFQRETGLVLPGTLDDPGRFRKRYNWIMANAKEKWIAWRCQKITQLYKRIRDRVRQARPDLKVYSQVFDAYPSEFGPDWLKGAGIDAQMLSRIDGVVLINALHAYGRRYDALTTQGTRDNLLDPSVLRALTLPGKSGAFLSYARYFEATDVVIPPEKIGFPPSTRKIWTSAVINPVGRNFLERYALALAETDASWLSDGGNGYTIGTPLLREFMQEYRSLPLEAFSPRLDARDPVAVWELARVENYLFYAVNREPFPVSIQFRLHGAGEVYRLSSGEKMIVKEGVLSLELQPFQLLSFKTTGKIHIAAITTNTPSDAQARLKGQIGWLETLNTNIQNGKIHTSLSSAQKQKFASATTEAKAAFNRGWVWRARTILENHELLPIYKSIGQYPPELRDNVGGVH